MKKGLKINTLTHIPKAGRLIALVSEDEPSVPSSRSIERSSSGPRTSERVFLATRTLRVTTPEVVLGMTERVFLSEGHPFLRRLDRSFQVEGTSGIVSASPSGLLSYHLELRVQMLQEGVHYLQRVCEMFTRPERTLGEIIEEFRRR